MQLSMTSIVQYKFITHFSFDPIKKLKSDFKKLFSFYQRNLTIWQVNIGNSKQVIIYNYLVWDWTAGESHGLLEMRFADLRDLVLVNVHRATLCKKLDSYKVKIANTDKVSDLRRRKINAMSFRFRTSNL